MGVLTTVLCGCAAHVLMLLPQLSWSMVVAARSLRFWASEMYFVCCSAKCPSFVSRGLIWDLTIFCHLCSLHPSLQRLFQSLQRQVGACRRCWKLRICSMSFLVSVCKCGRALNHVCWTVGSSCAASFLSDVVIVQLRRPVFSMVHQ
jgi:hypothetical protein